MHSSPRPPAATEVSACKRSERSNALKVYGPDLGALCGQTTQDKPVGTRSDYVSVPDEIQERFKELDVSVDIMFVNKIPFLVTLARGVKCIIGARLASRKKLVLATQLEQIRRYYLIRGFQVRAAQIDHEFECLRNLVNFAIKTVRREQHVRDIKRLIRRIKERMRVLF